MGLLDIYNNIGTQFNQIYNDYSTEYPGNITGIPTNTQNPGGPVDTFHQNYDENDPYIDTNDLYSGKLKNILDITNFDIEDPSVQGGPARPSDDPTNYPSTNTGTPTNTQNPGGPVRKFKQVYKPTKTYLSVNPIQGVGSGKLDDSLDITNLDVEDPSVNGGPARPADDPTRYPSTTTGVPTNTQNPGGPAKKFKQVYKPNKEYIYNIPNGVDGALKYTLDITNFDVQNPSVDGGPARPIDDPTHYPSTNTGTPTNTQNPGGPVRKFKQIYKPALPYLSVNPIQGVGSGKLDDSLDITNLDVENPSVQGGPVADNTTQYPQFSSGTPTIFINNLGSGPFNNSGAPANRFQHPYHPYYTYLFNLPNAGSGVLVHTLDITNFDVTSSNVQGGPLNDYTTGYISQYVTGVPTTQANYSVWNGGSGTGPRRFTQIYSPNNEYLVNVLSNGGILQNTLNITNFDVNDYNVFGGPLNDYVTNYQSQYVTGVPTTQSNYSVLNGGSGTGPRRFTQIYSPNNGYAASHPPGFLGSSKLVDTLDITNFDVEDHGFMGGPLNDISTVYPAANVTHTSPIRGWFAEPSQPPINFSHSFTPTNTYESFIQAYA